MVPAPIVDGELGEAAMTSLAVPHRFRFVELEVDDPSGLSLFIGAELHLASMVLRWSSRPRWRRFWHQPNFSAQVHEHGTYDDG
jgi:hypothetical protein